MVNSVSKILADYHSLYGDRKNWEDLWQQCADFCLPENNNILVINTSGSRRNDTTRFIDDGIRANETLAGGLFSYLTPPNQIWFKINATDEKIDSNPQVKEYFSEVNETIREHISSSNFMLQIHELFISLGVFGTGVLYTEYDEKGLNLTNFHLRNIFLKENNRNKVDTVFRLLEFTSRQAVQEFGLENLSEKIQKAYTQGKELDVKNKYLHACFPREDRQYGKIDSENKPFASIYIDIENKKIVKEGGYDSFPYHVVRFLKDSTEIYGRSPAMQCLSSLYSKNTMKRDIIKAGEQITNPQWLLPDNGSVSKISSRGGAIIYWNASNPNNKPERLKINGELRIGAELMDEEKRTIRDAFYNNIFDVLEDRKNMTATEVQQRVNSKLLLFPVIGRLQDELLKPMITRIYELLGKNGLLPDIPDELLNSSFDINFTGKISLAIEQLEVLSLVETLDVLMPMSQQVPQIMDNFDFDKITRGLARRNNMPHEFLRNTSDIDDLRKQRQQEQEQEKQMNMATQMADGASKLQKKTESGSPLEDIMEQMR